MRKLLFFLIYIFLFAASLNLKAEDLPEKPGWELTFNDEFDGPRLNDWYWYPAYRSGRKIFFKKQNILSRWLDPMANYIIENGILKLRIDGNHPVRLEKSERCVSSIQTSDHRFVDDNNKYQVLDKFSQKYGWFEIRARMPKGSGLHCAFWLLQTDPNKQEYTPGNRRRQYGEGVVEIDIFEMLGNQFDKKTINFNVHFTKEGRCEHQMDFDPSENFHRYALEWQEGQLNWYIDDKKVYTYKGETPKEKMFILLGIYQGAFPNWAGETNLNMPYPRDFEIDYVRVFKKNKT